MLRCCYAPLGMRGLSQIGSKSSPLSWFSFDFKVLIWMDSRTLLENSLGSHSNTLTFSQSIWWPLLLMTCSLMADLELPVVDLCSLSLFSSFLANSPIRPIILVLTWTFLVTSWFFQDRSRNMCRITDKNSPEIPCWHSSKSKMASKMADFFRILTITSLSYTLETQVRCSNMFLRYEKST